MNQFWRHAAMLVILVAPLTACAPVTAPAVGRTESQPIAAGESDRITVQLVTRPGVTQPLYVTQPAKITGSVILFPGGDGVVSHVRKNFLLRSESLFRRAGLLVAAFDVPSDRGSMDGGFRKSAEHAQDIAAAIRHVRGLAPGPLWLIGTSAGSPSALTGGALPRDGPDGVIVSSSLLSRFTPRTSVWDTDWRQVRVPVLVVHHRGDACRATPYYEAQAFVAALKKESHAPRVEMLSFSGGGPLTSGPCEAMHYHGYVGIEQPVIQAMIGWMLGLKS